jgi:hypothetical protein
MKSSNNYTNTANATTNTTNEKSNGGVESTAYITMIVLLIVTFLASCMYIGIDSFFSK